MKETCLRFCVLVATLTFNFQMPAEQLVALQFVISHLISGSLNLVFAIVLWPTREADVDPWEIFFRPVVVVYLPKIFEHRVLALFCPTYT